MARKAVSNEDLILLRLADCEMDHAARSSYYEDLAESYGDAHLFKIAMGLRERGLVGWGTNWTSCWLTDKGDQALSRATDRVDKVA